MLIFSIGIINKLLSFYLCTLPQNAKNTVLWVMFCDKSQSDVCLRQVMFGRAEWCCAEAQWYTATPCDIFPFGKVIFCNYNCKVIFACSKLRSEGIKAKIGRAMLVTTGCCEKFRLLTNKYGLCIIKIQGATDRRFALKLVCLKQPPKERYGWLFLLLLITVNCYKKRNYGHD